MTLKEARKATRGMYTRIETETAYNLTLYDKKLRTTFNQTVTAVNITQAKKSVCSSDVILLNVEVTGTTQIMYAMNRDRFKESAQKIIKLED